MRKNTKTYLSVSAQNLEPHARILTASHFDINRALGNRITKITN